MEAGAGHEELLERAPALDVAHAFRNASVHIPGRSRGSTWVWEGGVGFDPVAASERSSYYGAASNRRRSSDLATLPAGVSGTSSATAM